METIVNPRAVIGSNQPPEPIVSAPASAEELQRDLDGRYEDLNARFKVLTGSAERAPSYVETEEICGKMQDLIKQIRVLDSALEAARKIEEEPYKTAAKAVGAWFINRSEVLSNKGKTGWKEKLTERVDKYLQAKADRERAEREKRAQEERERAEALARQAAEAERQRIEAERKRQEEERKLAQIEADKLRKQQEAAEAEARAAAAKAEAVRLERERREREEREKLEAAKREQQRLIDDAAAARQAEERRIAREKEEAEISRLKALRQEEELKAHQARAQAAEKRTEAKQAELALKEAAADVREAHKDEKTLLNQAVRAEKRADKLDTAAGAKESELAQTRSDHGTVGTLAKRWTFRVVEREKIDLERLRYFLNPDAVDAAIYKFMQAGNRELSGVEFYEDTTAVVI